jgi:hypothetical protein
MNEDRTNLVLPFLLVDMNFSYFNAFLAAIKTIKFDLLHLCTMNSKKCNPPFIQDSL